MDTLSSDELLVEPKSPINIGNRSPPQQHAFESENENGRFKKSNDSSGTRRVPSSKRYRRSSPKIKTSPSRHQRSSDRYRHRFETQSTLLIQSPTRGIIKNDGMAYAMMSRDQSLSPVMDIGRPPSPPEPYYSPKRNHLQANLLFRDTSRYYPESNSYNSLLKPKRLMAEIEIGLFPSGVHLVEPKTPIYIGNRSLPQQCALHLENENDRFKKCCHDSRSMCDHTRHINSRMRQVPSDSRYRNSSSSTKTSLSRHYQSSNRYRHRSETKSTLLVQSPTRGISKYKNDRMAYTMRSRDKSLLPVMDIGHPPSVPEHNYSPNNLNADLYRDTSKYNPESNSDDSSPKPEHLTDQIEVENFSSGPTHSKDCVRCRKPPRQERSFERRRCYSPIRRTSPFNPKRRSPIRIDHKRRSPIRIDDKRKSPFRVDHKRKSSLSVDHKTRSSLRADHKTRSSLRADHKTRSSLRAEHKTRSPLKMDHKRDMLPLVHTYIKGRESVENDKKKELHVNQEVIKQDAKNGKNKGQDQSNLKSRRPESPQGQLLYPSSSSPMPNIPGYVQMLVPRPPPRHLPPRHFPPLMSIWRPRPLIQMPFSGWPYPHNSYRMAHPIRHNTNLPPMGGPRHVRPPMQEPSYGWRYPY